MGLSFNYPFEIGDSNGAIKSDIAQLQQDVGNLSQLETADKSSLVNALNEALDSTLNGVNRDLSNLSDLGNEKLRSLNSYANYGELLRDADGLSFVQKYAHSTFDKSKFTVVDSPTITDDGRLLNGAVRATGIKSEDFANKDFEFEFEFKTLQTLPTQSIMLTGSSNSPINGPFQIYYQPPSTLYCSVFEDVGGTSTKREILLTRAWIENETYTVKCKKVGNIVTYSRQGKSEATAVSGTITLSNSLVSNNSPLLLETNNTRIQNIDLKRISLLVDGVPVFSGNKTGIDTIKPDDYTVVGTPTISADGVASGFSTSNYVNFPLANIDTTKEWLLKETVYFDGNTGTFVNFGGKNWMQIKDTGALRVIFSVPPTNDIIIPNWTNLSPNNWYDLLIHYDGNHTYTFKSRVKGTINWINNVIYDAGEKRFSKSDDYGSLIKSESPISSIDLNSFKVYVDGDLVYQPCLKVPYTESKTGSKIVDSIYRDRVKDLFEQEGYNIYYTLGEDDFTLPSNKPNDIVKYKANGLTVAEQRADQTLTIRGACESGTDVNLPMEFFDADSYAVFGVGTTGTNTASKFTPAADGNYIAIGKGKV